MLTVAALTRSALERALAGPGLDLQTGPFVTRLRTDISLIADGVALLYGAYAVLPPGGFADFHLHLFRPRGLRRWYRPQVLLESDGHQLFEPLPLSQAFPMFEWGLNWCVSNAAHSYLIIHAAVLEKDGRAVILPAPPGSGKSTLCAALAHRGWRLLSDELTLVRLDDSGIVPMPRPVSLKNASITLMRDYLDQPVLSRGVVDTVKGTVAHLMAPADSVVRSAETTRAAWVVFPRYVADAPPTLTPIAKARGHMRVAENAFNYSTIGEPAFRALAGLIDDASCYEFSYSSLDDAVAVFAQLTPEQP